MRTFTESRTDRRLRKRQKRRLIEQRTFISLTISAGAPFFVNADFRTTELDDITQPEVGIAMVNSQEVASTDSFAIFI